MLLPLVVLENLQTVLLTDLRAKRRAVAFSIGSAVRLIGTVGASLWFVAIREQGVTGVFLGRFIGDAISVMILASFCLRGFQFGFSSDLIRPMVRFGAPVIWSALVVMLLDAFGRHFVSQYDTIEQVGIYAASMKVSKLMRMLLVQPVGVAWGGLMFQVSQWSKAQRVFSQAFMYISVTALLIATGAALFAPALFRLFATPAYFEGIDTFPLLLLAQVCAVVHYPASTGLYVKEKTHLFVPIYAGAVTVAFFASWLLVPNLGIRGAALGLVSGWIVILGLETLLGQKYYPLRIEWGVLIAAIVFCAIIVYIANHYTLGVSLTDIVLQLIFFVISVMILGGWIVADLARFGQWENKRSEPSPDQS
jgi:O-antigen/teichoic acid export membrane protein